MSNKKICAFFGHGDCPSTISDSLEKEIISAVKNNAITTFWYGGYGQFDALAAKAVTRAAKKLFSGNRTCARTCLSSHILQGVCTYFRYIHLSRWFGNRSAPLCHFSSKSLDGAPLRLYDCIHQPSFWRRLSSSSCSTQGNSYPKPRLLARLFINRIVQQKTPRSARGVLVI